MKLKQYQIDRYIRKYIVILKFTNMKYIDKLPIPLWVFPKKLDSSCEKKWRIG